MNPELPTLRLATVQTGLAWENPAENLLHFESLVAQTAGRADLTVLPEMFTTGFTMQPRQLAEQPDGPTLTAVRRWAANYETAIAGTFIATDGARFFNRAFFVEPDGRTHCYDKRHLFSMAGENDRYTAGTDRLILSYRGWRICPLICYDLRFPVWSRNTDEAFDLLLYMANWPAPRRRAWLALLPARAIENAAYVCGVNRIGTDGHGIRYAGDSQAFNAKGEALFTDETESEGIRYAELSINELRDFRRKFPVLRDADRFTIETGD